MYLSKQISHQQNSRGNKIQTKIVDKNRVEEEWEEE